LKGALVTDKEKRFSSHETGAEMVAELSTGGKLIMPTNI
jgi:hypothetical protein